MANLVALPKTKEAKQFVVVMTDLCIQLKKAISATKTNAIAAVCIILEHRVANHSISSRLLADYEPPIVLKFVLALCSTLETNSVILPEYQPEDSGQAERLKSTLILQSSHYLSKHQKDWDTYLPWLTTAYNAKNNKCIKARPLSSAFTRTPWSGHGCTKTCQLSIGQRSGLDNVRKVEVNMSETNLRREADWNLQLSRCFC